MANKYMGVAKYPGQGVAAGGGIGTCNPMAGVGMGGMVPMNIAAQMMSRDHNRALDSSSA